MNLRSLVVPGVKTVKGRPVSGVIVCYFAQHLGRGGETEITAN